MKPIDESKLPLLVQGNKHADENLFLHSLLNCHLPDGDQLPVSGAGAHDFGPRTLAKVKLFQELNKIDISTGDFKDGRVGRHTWAKLLEKQQCCVTVVAVPPPRPPLPPIFVLPPISPPLIVPPLSFPRFNPLPPPIPAPKLELSGQFQIGEQGQFPTRGQATTSHSIQIVGVFLNKNNKDNFHVEGQVGPQISFNRGGDPGSSKTDLQFNAVLNLANMPLSGGRFTWSVPLQLALIKSLSNPSRAGQLSGAVQASLTLIKAGDNDVLQVTTALGGFWQLEAPSDANGNKWKVTGGPTTFFGFSGTFFAF